MSGARRFPCGCAFDNVGDAFVLQPCSRDCPVLRYTLHRVQEDGKELRVIQDPAAGAVPLVYRCPGCGRIHGAQTEVGGDGGAVPEPGDLGVCWHCGDVFRFTEAGPVSLDGVELVAVLAEDRRLGRMVAAIRARK